MVDILDPTNDLADLLHELGSSSSGRSILVRHVITNGPVRPRNVPDILRIFDRAIEFGHTALPMELIELCRDRDVLEFGCGPTLHGAVLRALGARSYTGIDGTIDPRRKRFRNRLLKESVGTEFSMVDVSRLIPGVVFFRNDRLSSRAAFDTVLVPVGNRILRSVPTAIEDIARVLRPGGVLWMRFENAALELSMAPPPAAPETTEAEDMPESTGIQAPDESVETVETPAAEIVAEPADVVPQDGGDDASEAPPADLADEPVEPVERVDLVEAPAELAGEVPATVASEIVPAEAEASDPPADGDAITEDMPAEPQTEEPAAVAEIEKPLLISELRRLVSERLNIQSWDLVWPRDATDRTDEDLARRVTFVATSKAPVG